jgi:hypothetical protein
MRRIPFLFVLAFFAACNANDEAKVKSAAAVEPATTKAEPAYAYTPSYSAKFEIGDPAHSKTVLDLLKTWDNNDPVQAKQLFADTLTILAADGAVLSGTTDSVLNATAPYRNSLGTVTTKVHAWAPLRSTDKNENWVTVWFTEYRQKNGGKKDSVELQETWRLNNAGRADMIMQYVRKNPTAKK